MMANAVKERPVARWTLANNFVPLKGNQILIGGKPGAAVEHHDDLKEQYFGASKYQRDLLDMWWKQQGFTSLLPYNRLKKDKRHANIEVGYVCLLMQDNCVRGTYRLCRLLRDETSTRGQSRAVKVGYEWEEISVGVQRLVPTYRVKLRRMSAIYDFGLPRACCPGSPSNADEQDADAADVLPRRSLRLPETAMMVEDT